MKKRILIALLSLLVVSCGGGGGGAGGNNGPSNNPPPENTKKIYFENDINDNPQLIIGANDVAIVDFYTNEPTNKIIPFTVPQAGVYNLCLDGADNVLQLQVVDEFGVVVTSLNTDYSMECGAVALSAQPYDLIVKNIEKPDAISFYLGIGNGFVYSTAPYIRHNEKRQILSDVEQSDWDSGLNLIKLSLGLDESIPVSGNISHRRCYTTPVSQKSPVVFRQDSNKLLVSFRADFSEGEKHLCTYVEAINGNPANPNSAGDVGDIDSIIADFVNSGPDSEGATSSLAYSRPRSGDTHVTVGADVVIGVDGVLDRLAPEQAFTITPVISGVSALQGSVFTFDPTGELDEDTVYTVTLAGLSDSNSTPINDVTYTFRTEKKLTVLGTETAFSNAELCSLGVSEYCSNGQYSTLTSLNVNVLNSSSAGSRYLEVKTVLDKATYSDVLFKYTIETDTGAYVTSSGFVIESGKASDTDYIELKDSDFDKAVKNVVVKIQAYSVFHQLDELLGTWSIYNGEFFANAASVVTNDTNVASVTGLSFIPGATEHDRKLVVTLNQPATEEVNLKIQLAKAFNCLCGVDGEYEYPEMVAIAKGMQQVEVDVKFLHGYYPNIFSPFVTFNGYTNYSSILTPSIVDARNATFASLNVQAETITVIEDINRPLANGADINVVDTTTSRLIANDPNQFDLTYEVVTQAVYGDVTVDKVTGEFSYTKTCTACASQDSFTYKVNNGYGDSAVATVLINIQSSLVQLPVAEDGAINVAEDQSTSAVFDITDLHGTSRAFVILSQTTKGVVTLDNAASGIYSYTPNSNETGYDSFTYNVTNEYGVSNTGTVVIYINPVNDVPVAQTLNFTVLEDEEYSGQLSALEYDNDALTFTRVSFPALGQFNGFDPSTGAFRYQGLYNQNGNDSFTYKVNDGVSDSNTVTVNITVTPVNDMPLAYSDVLYATAGSAVNDVLAGVDAEGAALSYSIVTPPSPSMGAVLITNASTGDYTYTANAGVSGEDSFSFKVNDGNSDSLPTTVKVRLYADATTPLSLDRTYDINEDERLSGVSVSSYSPTSTARVHQLVSGPINGELIFYPSGSFNYLPQKNYSGTVSFTYQTTDDFGTSNIATVTINIAQVEDTPVGVFSEKLLGTGESIDGVLEATDGDSNPITYSVVTLPDAGSVNIDSVSGAYTYTSTDTVPGSDYFIWKATDSNGNSSTAVVFFTIFDASNVKPVASGLSVVDLNGGDVVANDILQATYIYSDADTDAESSTRIRWLRNGIEILDEVSDYYTVLVSDVGNTISFDVLPAAESGRELGVLAVSNSVSVILPDVFLSMGFGIKQLKFSWQDNSGATYFKLLENKDGASGFTQLGADITALNFDYEISVHLHDWDNAKYLLQACDALNVCTDSNALTTFSIDSSNDKKTTGYFKASNTEDGDNFGSAVAISADGNTMIVGAPEEDSSTGGINGDQANNGASNSGAVYLFNKANGVWNQQAYIKAPTPQSSGRFGSSVAISADGNTVAIGGGLNYEDVNIYKRVGNSWSHQVLLNALNTDAGDDFGLALAMSADGATLVIGAPGESSAATGINGDQNDNTAFSSGAAYVFKEVGGVWSQQTYLKALNIGNADGFGENVAISADGQTIAIAALGEDNSSTGVNSIDQTNNDSVNSGAVYIFVENTGVWSQQSFIKASNTDGSDYFGQSLVLSSNGDRLVVAADRENGTSIGVNGPQDVVDGQANGAVYVFDRSSNVWSQQAYIKVSEAAAATNFGRTLSMTADGNMLVVGGYSSAGYLLTFNNSQWQHERLIKASNDVAWWVGVASAISADGTTLVMSNPREQSNATGIDGDQTDKSITNAGAVYLY